ncbi:hypothetical protein JW851_03910, partial [Candidatus Woesearchaeota archaeon]|nr:hypothetical protein [Candidatus Woesearchaeota archaeon]
MDLNTKSISEEDQDSISKEAEIALDGLLIDPGIITGNTQLCITEVGKRALDIFHQFETDTTKITFGQLQDLVYSQGTQ